MEMPKDSYFQRIEVFAKTETQRLKLSAVYPEALAYALILSGPNIVTKVISLLDTDIEKLLADLKENLVQKSKKHSLEKDIDHGSLVLSKQTKIVMQETKDCCKMMNDPIIGSQHLLLALLKSDAKSKTTFKKYGITFEVFKNALHEMVSINKDDRDESLGFEESKKEQVSDGGGETAQQSQKHGNKESEILSKFCRDLNAMASKNRLDPVIGRQKEMDRIIATLTRRKKNNPILLGEPGVGKTSIIEGIAQRIVQGVVPEAMKNKRIFSLNLAAVVGKSQYRGQFEEKMRGIIQVFGSNPNYVLFVDEVHTLLGAGSSIGGLDAANIMKPALASGEIRCIGATTEEEYRKYFKRDGALERRFQRIMVDEPSREETKIILDGIRPTMEKHHNCKISEDALAGAVNLTHRYIRDRHFPDKAIDCIDEACAKFLMGNNNKDKVITYDQIVDVIAEQAGISKEIMHHSETGKISRVETFLRRSVVGQSSAIDSITRVLKNAYSGVRNPDRPIGSFVFGGPSGCGKTLLAEKLAEGLFDSKASLIRINLAEFSEKHNQSRLVGSPPGYVGFGDKNQLTDRIIRRPYSLVLLDGIDHAHPDVLKIFLQVFSDGVMTDAEGREINFRNAVIVMTMNVATDESRSEIGFEEHKSDTDYERKQAQLISACKGKLDEEFCNKIDEFVAFENLSEENLAEVAKILLDSLKERLHHNNISLSYSDDVPKKLVAMRKTSHGLNAKPIERLIIKEIEPAVSENILGSTEKSKTVILSVSKDGRIVASSPRSKKKATKEK